MKASFVCGTVPPLAKLSICSCPHHLEMLVCKQATATLVDSLVYYCAPWNYVDGRLKKIDSSESALNLFAAGRWIHVLTLSMGGVVLELSELGIGGRHER